MHSPQTKCPHPHLCLALCLFECDEREGGDVSIRTETQLGQLWSGLGWPISSETKESIANGSASVLEELLRDRKKAAAKERARVRVRVRLAFVRCGDGPGHATDNLVKGREALDTSLPMGRPASRTPYMLTRAQP